MIEKPSKGKLGHLRARLLRQIKYFISCPNVRVGPFVRICPVAAAAGGDQGVMTVC